MCQHSYRGDEMRFTELQRFAEDKLRSSQTARRIRRSGVVELAFQKLRRSPILRLHQVRTEFVVSPGDTIVDCGANVGQVTSQFARTGAAIHAFEPNPHCYQILRERFKHVHNVTIHHNGAMDRACVLRLRVLKQSSDLNWDTSVAGSFHPDSTRIAPSDDSFVNYDIACIDLAEWVLNRSGRIRLLKLDIEGSEIPVINHLIDSGAIERIDLLICETHESMNASLIAPTEALRSRIVREGLTSRIRLDWP